MKDSSVTLIWIIIILAVIGFAYYFGTTKGTESVTTSTRIVTVVDTVRIVNNRYIPKIITIRDTIHIESPHNDEIAILDTLVSADRYNVSTHVRYHYPDRYFEFEQNVVIKTDTVYVNVDRINTVGKSRAGYYLVGPAVVVGLVSGILLMR